MVAQIISTSTITPRMSDRKRKRESSGVEKPRKKRTYSPSTQPPSQPPKSITIELPTDTAAVKPLLVTTPGLEIHSSTSFRIYESSAHELLLHSSPHPASNLDFTGRLQLRAEHASKTPPAYRNYIAVFDPVTSTLQILPALPLEIRRSFRPTAKDLATEASRAVKQTAMVQRQQLGLEFGTKKAKKLIESRTTNAIQSGRGPAAAAAASDSASQGQDRTVGPSQQSLPGELDDPLTRAVLQSISESVSHMPTRAEMQQEADAAKPRPKPDLSATSLEAVYPVALLVGADELQLVDVTGWEQAVAGKMPVRTRSRFVSERIVRTVGEGGVEKLKALRFLLGLVDYHQALVKSGGGGRAGATKKVLEAGKLREVLGMEGALASRINGRFSTDKYVSFCAAPCPLTLPVSLGMEWEGGWRLSIDER